MIQTRQIKIGTLGIGGGNPPRVMGVINLSAESFYSQSVENDESKLEKRVLRMIEEGVEIIDLGGASTAPKEVYGTKEIGIDEEYSRVKRGIQTVREFSDVLLSIDTTSSEIAEMALKQGVQLVNDVSGLQNDPHMAKVVAEYDVPVILMAMPTHPNFEVKDAINRLQASIDIAIQAEIDENKIILDPGIGFGKPAEYDIELIKELNRFKILGYPILVGVSRKAFIGTLLGQPNPKDRLVGTISATAIAVANGADMIRAHDVYEAVQASIIGGYLRRQTVTHEKIELVPIQHELEGKQILRQIGTGREITGALSKKMVSLCLRIKQVPTPGALILKQEMLALGGDAAYHHDTIDFEIEYTDVILMGTILQIERLMKKVRKMTYFGLKEIGISIEKILQTRERSLR
ncbi:MAG: hypothetical protein BAJATHORv1_20318 [Candidatus Thorarchaeota archaeon]|nr:MAG: hypothetical protein BAJATHORv1_20318 [Candidatus Thorarchaeota archaeon]